MDQATCDAMKRILASHNITPQHLQILLEHEADTVNAIRFALTQIALKQNAQANPEAREIAGGKILFTQGITPLPLDFHGWKFYINQRNKQSAASSGCDLRGLDTVNKPAAFHRPLLDISSIHLLDTEQGTLNSEQAHRIVGDSVNCDTKEKTTPMLVFEVLRYFWSQFSDINAAYILINKRIDSLGFPVIFNSQSNGKMVKFLSAIPAQSQEYTGYYAMCS